jgi:dihydrofolate reductase
MAQPVIAAIVGMDEGRIIGRDGGLPWNVPEDIAHFKSQTTGHVVIMGRKTWESLPPRFRPLPARTNVVISRAPESLSLPAGVVSARSVEEAVSIARGVARPDQIIWFIGGGEVYRSALPLCDEVHLTLVYGHHSGDATFPLFEDDFVEVSSRSGDQCAFKVYRRA